MINISTIINGLLWQFNLKLIRLIPRPVTLLLTDKKELVGCEVGVERGDNARDMLKRLHIKKLYLIDFVIWHGINDSRIVNIENWSRDGIGKIKEKLDFAYIDGSHDYTDVKNDIEQLYPKIKAGGILSGHDFDNEHLGVIKAVTDFCIINNLQLNVRKSDWWVWIR